MPENGVLASETLKNANERVMMGRTCVLCPFDEWTMQIMVVPITFTISENTVKNALVDESRTRLGFATPCCVVVAASGYAEEWFILLETRLARVLYV